MIPSLAAAFAPPFHWYAASLRLAGGSAADDGAVPPLDMERMRPVLARFAVPFAQADRRATVSLWSQYYFAALIVPTVAVAARLGRRLPVAAAHLRLRADENGAPAAFLLRDDGAACGGADPLSCLVDGHLAPVIGAMSSAFAATPRLLWSNAAAILEWSLSQAAADDAAHPGIVRHGFALLAAEALPDGRRNPLFEPVRYPVEGGAPVRRRRVCCLRYLLPGDGGCGPLCPLPAVRGTGCEGE